MRYEIDTIPVWDALKTDCECWMCLLEVKARNQALKYYLGPSVMTPETRVEVNAQGFSPDHWRLLAKDPNRQGLGLIVSTHLRTLRGKIQESTQELLKQAKKLSAKSGVGALMASKEPVKKNIQELVEFIDREESSCLIQDRIQEALGRYSFTAAHLYLKDPDFPVALKKSRGPCLPHLQHLLKMGLEVLPPRELGFWTTELLELTGKNLERLENEVVHFTQMFDSKNAHADWGNTKDSPGRAIQKITGAFKERDEGRGRI